jgi:predicted nucleic acid-binding protein
MRIYVDTSVVGGVFDDELREASQSFFGKARAGEFVIVVSRLLRDELVLAPEHVRSYLEEFESPMIEEVSVPEEALDLADIYVAEKVVGATSLADCQHIATATIHRVDVLVSWNFKHIVNLKRIRGYNSVNLKHGYPMLEIRTPIEVLDL